MTYNIKNVIVSGASGNLGPSIVKALVDSGKFNVSILARPTSTATFPHGVKVIRSEYTLEALEGALKGQDAVVSTIGDFNSQGHIIEAAVKAGVQRFIPSDFGGDTNNEHFVSLFPLAGGKVKIGKLLEEKAKAHSSFSWTSIFTGAFFDWALKTGFFGIDIQAHTALIYETGDEKFAGTSLADIGTAVVGVLLHPTETANRAVHIASVEASQNQILAALEKATGPPEWTIKKTTIAEAQKTGNALLAKGDYSGLKAIILSAIIDPKSHSQFSSYFNLDNELLGLPHHTLDQLVAEALKA
ncbi:MAG: hypothetical protein M1829_000664 [Trizodia sp. TS-e1964]|nr:MAG: hypothetical protein M1829_000664 [Trizodia sp. TS-e1964]